MSTSRQKMLLASNASHGTYMLDPLFALFDGLNGKNIYEKDKFEYTRNTEKKSLDECTTQKTLMRNSSHWIHLLDHQLIILRPLHVNF
mmetsp:Transcript_23055/g.54707  ORF Transcript_23055/g.54707 Transcript_23055/m.54707 type:complete len:88 (+) Transcript_23055:1295-1558(+)